MASEVLLNSVPVVGKSSMVTTCNELYDVLLRMDNCEDAVYAARHRLFNATADIAPRRDLQEEELEKEEDALDRLLEDLNTALKESTRTWAECMERLTQVAMQRTFFKGDYITWGCGVCPKCTTRPECERAPTPPPPALERLTLKGAAAPSIDAPPCFQISAAPPLAPSLLTSPRAGDIV